VEELADSSGDGVLPGADITTSLESKASQRLRQLLAECDPTADFEEHLAVLEKLGRFVVDGPHIPGPDHPSLSRLRVLVEALEKVPSARTRFCGVVRSVLENTRAVKLFGEVGLPNHRGLWSEMTDRIAKRFLPEAPMPHEMWWLVNKIIRTNSDLEWLDEKADPYLHRLVAVTGDAWEPVRRSVIDAITMITTRIAALGMNEAFRTRASANGVATSIRDSPLYHLTRARPEEMPALIASSRRYVEQVKAALEARGVSVEVVYALDSIEHGLTRIEILLPFVDGEDVLEPTYEIRALVTAFGRGLVANRSFRRLMSDNLRLLARKVIERAGRTGEIVVASSRAEYVKTLKSAAGGGVVMAGTLLFRWFVKWWHLAPFFDGLLSSAVFAVSFVALQLLGFTLATKQSSMTAAALAGSIRDTAGPQRLTELVPLITRMARSQFAAAAGNVTAVVVTVTAIDFLCKTVMGHPFLDPTEAETVVRSLDPTSSWTILYAAITGVILWLSSLFAGWFENWVVYRRLPEAIENPKHARFLEREAAGLGGSVALGVLFGMLPPLLKFTGITIEVRHVTLSSGSLAFAISSLGLSHAGMHAFIWAAVGIFVIGLLNFGVSFALALVVAMRARDVPREERRALPLVVFKYFTKHPVEFFVPPKEPT
jgi:site-specific recombinase